MAGTITKGADETITITIRDKSNNPYDLTGKTVTVKTKIGGSLVEFADPDVSIASPTHGTITMYISDTFTEQLSVGAFNVDVYINPGEVDTKIVKIRNQATVEDRLR